MLFEGFFWEMFFGRCSLEDALWTMLLEDFFFFGECSWGLLLDDALWEISLGNALWGIIWRYYFWRNFWRILF